jgi:hypothetical protein
MVQQTRPEIGVVGVELQAALIKPAP